MRKALIVGSALVAALAVPSVGLAMLGGQNQGGAHVNCTASAATTSSVTTTSTTFANIASLELNVSSVFGMSESVTLVLTGSPVELKVMDNTTGGSFAMAPGVATIRGTSTDNGKGLTFVTIGAPAPHPHTIDVQWRLKSSGGSATIKRGAVNLLYEADDQGCPFV